MNCNLYVYIVFYVTTVTNILLVYHGLVCLVLNHWQETTILRKKNMFGSPPVRQRFCYSIVQSRQESVYTGTNRGTNPFPAFVTKTHVWCDMGTFPEAVPANAKKLCKAGWAQSAPKEVDFLKWSIPFNAKLQLSSMDSLEIWDDRLVGIICFFQGLFHFMPS